MTSGVGWFVYIRKAFISVLFLGFLKIWPFSETIVKSEAMVEAPGKFMLPSIHYIPSIGIVGSKFRIYLLRGRFYLAHSTIVGEAKCPKKRNEHGVAPAFLLYNRAI